MPKLLPSTWQTECLSIQNSGLADARRLQEVFNSCHYVHPWDKTFYIVSLEEIEGLVMKSVQTTPDSEKPFNLQTVRLKASGEMIGYYHLRYHHPHPGLIFITMFVIHKEYQKAGYAQEVTRGLLEQLRTLGEYHAVWLEVFVKNWPAMRFWINAGFTTIIDFEGDAALADETYASMVVERKL
jgi:diamine N-acetyltransferase